MSRLLLGWVLCAAWLGVAQAAPATLQQWDTGAVVDVLNGLKATQVQAGDFDGRPVITAKTDQGLNVGLYAKACDTVPEGQPSSCHGLEAIISFDPGSDADRPSLVNKLNHDFALGKFMVQDDGSIRLSRYLIFDGGLTSDNLRAELASFFAIGVLTGQTLWPEPAKP